MFPDVVESDASLLGVPNIDVERRVRTKPGVADTPMREERSLVEVRSLGERRHSSSSKIGRLVGLVVASERWVMDTSGREKGSMLVGRLVETSGLLKMSSVVGLVEASGMLKMSSVVRLVEASGMLKMSSVVRAARLHLRRGRSSQLNGWELLLLSLLKRSSRLDGWELLLLLVVHVVVPAT